MLVTLLLTALTATSGEDMHTLQWEEGHYTVRWACPFDPLDPFRSSGQWQSGRRG